MVISLSSSSILGLDDLMFIDRRLFVVVVSDINEESILEQILTSSLSPPSCEYKLSSSVIPRDEAKLLLASDLEDVAQKDKIIYCT